ncbi:hypothetical protein [Tunturiibacter gelidiferens]|uniref:hypothetical protein n=1 Tax=Tunturiibacter gelidiferens TaxID=3069689 RepID=UPI003D9B5912
MAPTEEADSFVFVEYVDRATDAAWEQMQEEPGSSPREAGTMSRMTDGMSRFR